MWYLLTLPEPTRPVSWAIHRPMSTGQKDARAAIRIYFIRNTITSSRCQGVCASSVYSYMSPIQTTSVFNEGCMSSPLRDVDISSNCVCGCFCPPRSANQKLVQQSGTSQRNSKLQTSLLRVAMTSKHLACSWQVSLICICNNNMHCPPRPVIPPKQSSVSHKHSNPKLTFGVRRISSCRSVQLENASYSSG